MFTFLTRQRPLSASLQLVRTCSQTAGPSVALEDVVSTTGYTYKNKEGRVVGRFGVFFGKSDSRNILEDVEEECTHVAAKIRAVIRAVQLATDNKPLRIRSDLKVDGLNQLNKWAAQGFKYHGKDEALANAGLLKELHAAVTDRKAPVELEFLPLVGKNIVTEMIIASGNFSPPQLRPDYFLDESTPGDTCDGFGRKAAYTSAAWPQVYTGATLTVGRTGFKKGGFCTIWPKREYSAPPQRLALIPVTLFRGQLSAIEDALKQALEVKMKRVLVITGSAHFIPMYKAGWKAADGTAFGNKFLYDRILDLATTSEMKVHFRYELDDRRLVWQTVREKSHEGLRFPLAARDRSSYDLTVDDITRKKNKDAANGNPVLRVRFFKKGTALSSGLLWDRLNDSNYQKSFNRLTTGDTADVILEILRKAVQEEKAESLVIRTDSTRLMRSIESWMPTWKQIGWRTVLNKKLVDKKKWEEADRLMDSLQITWELMNPPTADDVEAVEEFRKKKPRLHRKGSQKKVSLTDVITGHTVLNK